MSAARRFLRFAIGGLFTSLVVVACTIKEGDDSVTCNPGDYSSCRCSNGDSGERECNSDGDGYSRCVCDSSTGGTNSGQAGEGSGGTATTGGSSGGSDGYTAGSGGYSGYGGSAPAAGSGGVSGGGANEGGAAGAAGSAGSGSVLPAECAEDPEDACATCYQAACCEEWSACLDDDGDGSTDCTEQFFNILLCAQFERDTRDVTPDDLRMCAEEEIEGGGAWSDGLRPQVKPLVDCVAGGAGWSAKSSFSADCRASCFDQL